VPASPAEAIVSRGIAERPPSLDDALTLGLDASPGPEAARLSAFLARAFGPATVALVHYGSHTHEGGGPSGSAWDFFVIVDDYLAAYRALAEATGDRVPARRAARLNRILPPNVIAVDSTDVPPLAAKCCVLSLADLTRACSPRPRDHFVRARLFQPVQRLWVRDEAARDAVTAAIAAARAGTFAWARPFLPPSFDAARYARTLLAISYRAEIRPEDDARIDALLAVQRETLAPMFDALLADLADRRVLSRAGDAYADPAPPGAAARLAARAWFWRSKARATLRWAKYVALYDGWLDYVVKKVERRSGERFDLTERERRWPLLFLWPRALRFLGSRPQRRRG
jgi:hypothetical protein